MTTIYSFAFSAVSADTLPMATIADLSSGDATSQPATPPLPAEESDRWIEQALFDCYN
ncbi:MAG TPA: hypothetical protein VIK33_05260 [Anaerolineae bacterium]